MKSDPLPEGRPKAPALEQPAGHRSTYFRFGVGELDSPGESPLDDGAKLAGRCIESIGDTQRFPPRLFLFFPTAAFKPYRPVLLGLRRRLTELGFGGVPLIGSSVATCLSANRPHARERGVLLVCLASPFIKARVAVGEDAQKDHERAVGKILESLGLGTDHEVNARGNLFMYVFLPGVEETGDPTSYRAGEIIEALRRRTHARLPMFGGVSSGGIEPAQGVQFIGDNVCSTAAVVACVTCDIMCGIGLAHGLTETGEALRVTATDEGGHVITGFAEGPLEEVYSRLPDGSFLAEQSRDGDLIVAKPVMQGDAIRLRRRVSKRALLKVMRPDSVAMQQVARQMLERVLRRTHMRESRVAGLIGIGCVGRYRDRELMEFDVEAAVEQALGAFPGAGFAGVYMDGEIGLDALGRSILGNWSVSLLLLADDIPERSDVAIGFDCLADLASQPTAAVSIDEAAAIVMRAVCRAGYPGGMLSLVLKHGEKQWIVGWTALGTTWEQEILRLTRRELPGNDVLALVAVSGKPRFVRDSRDPEEHCDPKAVEAGGVLSQYIFPLQDEQGKTTAVFQVDLGDMRDRAELWEEQETLLVALGNTAAGLLSRVIHTEEVVTSRKLDRLLIDCLDCTTREEAAARFIQGAANVLHAEGHVRLLAPDNTNLRLVGGVGPYYEAAVKEREVIDLNDRSPSAETARTGHSTLCNETADDEGAQHMQERYKEGALGETLRRMRSFANFPIALPGRKPAGLVNICAPAPWFFTESTLRSVADIGQRLGLLLAHVERKQVQQECALQSQFVLSLIPRTEQKAHLNVAIIEHAERLRKAARADVVSFFLWESDRERFVLRTQAGWKDPRWVGAAWYARGEGMTGKLAMNPTPRYIPDLVEFKERTTERPGKYLAEMYGTAPGEGETYEVIAMPLNFRGEPLGIVTMHRKRSLPVADQPSGFAADDEGLLCKAGEALCSYVYALREHDIAEWRYSETMRLREIDGILLKEDSLGSLLGHVTQCIQEQYRTRLCAIYLADPESRRLDLAAQSAREPYSGMVPEQAELGDDFIGRAFATGRIVEHRHPEPEDAKDPAQVRQGGTVGQLCIPLKFGTGTLGVLDMRWKGTPQRSPDRLMAYHDSSYLKNLAEALAGAIGTVRLRLERRESERAAARSRLAVDSMAMALSKSFHQLSKHTEEVQSGLELLAQRKPAAEMNRVMGNCRKSVDAVVHILERARDLGRTLAHLRFAPHRLDVLLHEALNECQRRSEANGIAAHCVTEKLEGMVDAALVLEAFKNVIENAVEAMPNGGRLDVSMQRAGDECVTVIVDTGVGMAREEISRALGRKQADESRSAFTPTGMGLFLARLYCEAHCGDVDVESSPGQGTTVTLVIPLQQVREQS